MAALVQAARATAIRRGEVMRLEVEPSGHWRLYPRSGDGEPVGAGDVGVSGPGFRLVITPLGTCAAEVEPQAGPALPLDPLDCELASP